MSISGRELSVVALAALLSVQVEVPHEVVDRLSAYDSSQTRDTLIGEVSATACLHRQGL